MEGTVMRLRKLSNAAKTQFKQLKNRDKGQSRSGSSSSGDGSSASRRPHEGEPQGGDNGDPPHGAQNEELRVIREEGGSYGDKDIDSSPQHERGASFSEEGYSSSPEMAGSRRVSNISQEGGGSRRVSNISQEGDGSRRASNISQEGGGSPCASNISPTSRRSHRSISNISPPEGGESRRVSNISQVEETVRTSEEDENVCISSRKGTAVSKEEGESAPVSPERKVARLFMKNRSSLLSERSQSEGEGDIIEKSDFNTLPRDDDDDNEDDVDDNVDDDDDEEEMADSPRNLTPWEKQVHDAINALPEKQSQSESPEIAGKENQETELASSHVQDQEGGNKGGKKSLLAVKSKKKAFQALGEYLMRYSFLVIYPNNARSGRIDLTSLGKSFRQMQRRQNFGRRNFIQNKCHNSPSNIL